MNSRHAISIHTFGRFTNHRLQRQKTMGFIRDVVQDGLLKAVNERGGIKAVRYLCARKPSDVGIIINLDETWEYGLYFTSDKNELRITKEYVILSENGKKEKILERPNDEDRNDTMQLTQTALQQVNVNKAFRPVVDFFSSIIYSRVLIKREKKHNVIFYYHTLCRTVFN